MVVAFLAGFFDFFKKEVALNDKRKAEHTYDKKYNKGEIMTIFRDFKERLIHYNLIISNLKMLRQAMIKMRV